MDTVIKARQVADYVLLNWHIPGEIDAAAEPVSENIAAILVDAVFQAGLNYRTVVFPRVCAIAQAYPKMNSLHAFEAAMQTNAFFSTLAWRHPEKPERLWMVVSLLRSHRLETINDLCSWLYVTRNRADLLSIRGIGPKTVDYLSRLVGHSTIAVDRHAHRFLRDVGISIRGYDEAKRILEFAADLLRINRWIFDRIIWEALSGIG